MYVMVSQLYKQPDAAGMQDELLCIIVDYPRVGGRVVTSRSSHLHMQAAVLIKKQTPCTGRHAKCCTCAMLVLQL